MRHLFVTGALALISVSAAANENIKYVCTHDSAERVIEVVYTTPGQAVPCEIHYTKDGQTQTLWTYQNEAEQCESKAASFAEKQTGWGWQCTTSAAAEPAPEATAEPETPPPAVE